MDDEGGVSTAEVLYSFLPTLGMLSITMLAGYLSATTKLIRYDELLGFSKIIGYYSLPCLLFKTLAELDLGQMRWSFVLGVFIAKALVFALVLVLSLMLSRGPQRPGAKAQGYRYIESGLRAIVATQSNDFAFGLPVLDALYGASHPDYSLFLYLLSPISLVILNPLAFALCEYGIAILDDEQQRQEGGALQQQQQPLSSSSAAASPPRPSRSRSREPLTRVWLPMFSVSRRRRSTRPPGGSGRTGAHRGAKSSIALVVIRQLLSNPVVLSTFLGLAFNRHNTGGKLPPFLAMVLSGFANLFSVSSLFLMGANMVDTGAMYADSLWTTGLVLLAKMLVLPVLQFFFVTTLTSSSSLAAVAFIIGSLPVAPTVNVYGLRYLRPGGPDFCADLSVATVLSTLAGVPVLFLCVISLQIFARMDCDLFQSSVFYIFLVSTVVTAWVALCFLVGGRHAQLRYRDMFVVVCFTLVRSLLGTICFHTRGTASTTTTEGGHHGGGGGGGGGGGDMVDALILLSEVGMRVAAVVAAVGLVKPAAWHRGGWGRWAAYMAGGVGGGGAVILGSRSWGGDGGGVCSGCTPSSSSEGAFPWAWAACNLVGFVLCSLGLYKRRSHHHHDHEDEEGGDDGDGMEGVAGGRGCGKGNRRMAAAALMDKGDGWPQGDAEERLLMEPTSDQLPDGGVPGNGGGMTEGTGGAAIHSSSSSSTAATISKRRLLVITWSCFSMFVTVVRCVVLKLRPRDRLSFLSFVDVSLVGFQGCILLCLYGLEQNQRLWALLRQGLRRGASWLDMRGGSSTDDEEEEEEDGEQEEG